MGSVLKSVIKEIERVEKFNLKMYFEYVNKYGKEFMLKVFDHILENSKNLEEIYVKYFDVYFSLELEQMEIDDDSYLKLTSKYGEERVNEYFLNLLQVSKNSYEVKQKYEKIYFYIETIKSVSDDKLLDIGSLETDDIVRMYLKEIGSYPLLSAEEERVLLKEKNDLKRKIKIAHFDELDNIIFDNIMDVMDSVITKEHFVKLKKIVDKLGDSDREAVAKYIDEMNKVFKSKSLITNKKNSKYDYEYLNEQLEAINRYILVRDKLINSNLRLVVSIAKRYITTGVEMLDLISEGNLGLMRAVKKFDANKTTKISTYATWWIRQAITRYIADNANTIRIPVHLNEKINKYKQAVKKLTLLNSDMPTDQMIAEFMGISLSEVEDIKFIVYSNNCLSLDGFVTEDEDTSIIDLIPDENTTEDEYSKIELSEKIAECLDTLNEREADVLRYRFGFYGRPYTLEEVGQMFGVTRERIRQIEAKSLRRLRHASRSRKLRDFA